jgi:ferredoxin
MKAILFYFSGTGNSLYVARALSSKVDAEYIDIATIAAENNFIVSQSTIGIIFPVYYGRIPLIVGRFLQKLRFSTETYIFAVATYGGGTGECKEMIEQLLAHGNKRLNAFFGIHMVQNAFRKPWEKAEAINSRALSAIDEIESWIRMQREGAPLRISLSIALMHNIHIAFMKLYKKKLSVLSKLPPNEEFDKLINHSDASFSVLDVCNGCKICERVCPVGNITLRGNKPTWHGKCENCLACYNWCPKNAIKTGIVQDNYYYYNRHISVNDIIRKYEKT